MARSPKIIKRKAPVRRVHKSVPVCPQSPLLIEPPNSISPPTKSLVASLIEPRNLVSRRHKKIIKTYIIKQLHNLVEFRNSAYMFEWRLDEKGEIIFYESLETNEQLKKNFLEREQQLKREFLEREKQIKKLFLEREEQ